MAGAQTCEGSSRAVNRWSLTARVVATSQDLQDTPGRCRLLSKWGWPVHRPPRGPPGLCISCPLPWPSFPRHPGGIWYFSRLPGTHPGSAPTLCRTHPLVQSVVAWPRHARPAGRHPPGPAPYLHGDHLHLHVGREGQVGLEALGQGHEEMQGGQQVLAEDTWGGRGHEVRAPGIPKPGATWWAPDCHNHPLQPKELGVQSSGEQRSGNLRSEPKNSLTLLQSSFLQIQPKGMSHVRMGLSHTNVHCGAV